MGTKAKVGSNNVAVVYGGWRGLVWLDGWHELCHLRKVGANRRFVSFDDVESFALWRDDGCLSDKTVCCAEGQLARVFL